MIIFGTIQKQDWYKDIKNNENSLDTILDYIAKDDINYAIKFNRNLEKSIKNIPIFPYKSRKSLYYKDENIRDYIFKGYTLPYMIDLKNEQIVILDIFKWVDK